MRQLRGDIEERRTRVAEMLLARISEREMARKLRVSLGTISHDVAAVRAEWLAHRTTNVEQIASEDLARLERAEAAIWTQIEGGKLLAIDRLLAIMERRAKLLGLDAPSKVDITHRVRELAEQEGLDPNEAVQAAEELLRSSGY